MNSYSCCLTPLPAGIPSLHTMSCCVSVPLVPTSLSHCISSIRLCAFISRNIQLHSSDSNNRLILWLQLLHVCVLCLCCHPCLFPRAWDNWPHYLALLVGHINGTFRAMTWKVPAMLIPSPKTPCWKDRGETQPPPDNVLRLPELFLNFLSPVHSFWLPLFT